MTSCALIRSGWTNEVSLCASRCSSFYTLLCPLPQGQLAAGEFDAALEAVGNGAHILSAVVRDGPKGQPELIAEGYEYAVAMNPKVAGKVESWTERRLVVRSVRHAQAAEAALRARV